MFRDTNLEFSPWGVRTGPGIGGPVPFVAPKSFTVAAPTPERQAIVVAIEGTAYTDGMAVQQRPWIDAFDPSQILVRYEFDMLIPDGNAAKFAQAIETDLRLCSKSGYNYNGSFQNNNQEKGQIQVYGVAPKPAWQNTGIMIGMYAEDVLHHVEINYLINDTNTAANGMPPFSMNISSFELDGELYTIPAAFQNSPGALLNWVPGAYEQLQHDLNSTGGAFEIEFSDIAIDWM